MAAKPVEWYYTKNVLLRPRCQDSEGKHRAVDSVVPFSIRQGTSGKIKIEGQEHKKKS